MSRLQTCFERLRVENRKALIPYIMTGDPHPEVTVPLMHAMVEAGADVIELGAPFSDPMADGPVIQAAAERALEFNITLNDVFSVVSEFRKLDDNTPIVMMGYLNLIEVAGYVNFARQAAEAGIDGVITVDMPPEEASDYLAALDSKKLDPVFLIAPTSTEQRIAKIGSVASGFVYYVSLKGVTGAANLDVADVREKVDSIRKKIDLPIGVGFGISDAQAAAQISACSDAVVVGSAIVKRMAVHQQHSPEQTQHVINDVSELLSSMRAAMDAGPAVEKTRTA
ncbi:MAG: tryptophan synthase subunit alpha [Gammaproteobacteria bacterium]|nr:tryptophan synthase subunit alpha [Gammaproteobacteria bacterium]